MKLNEQLRAEIECALDMRKKDGTRVWADDQQVEVSIAGIFASDKFIVIKKAERAVSSRPPVAKEEHGS